KLTDFLALQKQVGALTAALASKQDRVIFKETDGTETSITDYLTKVGQRVNTMEQGLIAVTNEVKAMESWDGSLDSKIDSQSHLLRSIAEAVQAKPLAVSSRSLPQQSADPVCEVVMSPTNSLADSAENLPPAVVKVCALLGVKDSTLLRFLPDAEIDKYCSKFVGHGAAATTSSDFGAVSFASGDDHTADEVPTMSRMLQIVKSIKLPNERCYEGYQDDRLGVDYLRSTYSASDDPSFLEDRISSLRQKGDENVFQYLDRLNVVVAQARLCGLNVSEAQVCKYYRQVAASKLATELYNFGRLNGTRFQEDRDDKTTSTGLLSGVTVIEILAISSTFLYNKSRMVWLLRNNIICCYWSSFGRW
ncbi:hypothetical protein FOZ63_027628, partial [Perkinsus olseni]